MKVTLFCILQFHVLTAEPIIIYLILNICFPGYKEEHRVEEKKKRKRLKKCAGEELWAKTNKQTYFYIENIK